MGEFPVTEEASFAGGTIRFLHGTAAFGHKLQLQFGPLTESEAQLIRAHYRAQQGGYLSFALSSEAWAGHSNATDLVPTTTQWCYAEPIQEEHTENDFINITISLVAVI